MAHFLLQGAYAADAWAGMANDPQDRTGPAKALVESLGGKLHCLYFCFGGDDFVAIVELPDNVSAATSAIVLSSTRAFRDVRTTVLLTAAEMVEAMKKAGKIAYKAPGR